MDFFGCLFNTFVYIEIGGTGGSAFRPMYAKFLEEASSMVDEPNLDEVAKMLKESGKVWAEIAMAALPDSWPILRKTRELTIEKNRIFEEQESGALEKTENINIELDELRERDTAPLLEDLKQKIIECHQIEERAFRRLNEVVQ